MKTIITLLLIVFTLVACSFIISKIFILSEFSYGNIIFTAKPTFSQTQIGKVLIGNRLAKEVAPLSHIYSLSVIPGTELISSILMPIAVPEVKSAELNLTIKHK